MSNRRKIKKKKDKKARVAIVGTAPSAMLAPRDGEVWATNAFGTKLPHCTMYVDMHNFNWSMEENIANYSHLKHLIPPEQIEIRAKNRANRWEIIKHYANMTGTPLMSTVAYPDIPSSFAFPFETITKWADCNYFTSTIAYMLAYATFKGFKRIELYGCDVEHAEEWAYQRDCITGWIMYAKGKGRIVTVSGSDTRPLRAVDGVLYGYSQKQPERAGQWYTQKVHINDLQEDHDVPMFKEF